MYRCINLNDKEGWDTVIKSFNRSDIYFQWGYVKAFEIHGDGEPFIFYYEDENGRVANIFFLRDISHDESFRNKLQCDKYFDIRSVYGYGGLLYEGVNIEKLILNYTNKFSEYCVSNNIVCEFIRFNPLLENHRYMDNFYSVIPSRKTIYIDLSKDEKYIWENLKSENRTRIRKAIRNGIEIVKGRDEELLEGFMKIYKHTMDRDRATPYYYFEKEFFYTTLKELSENSIIFAAKLKDKIIAASLILFNDHYVHYHLGGSDGEYMNLAPNNLLFFEIAKWGCSRGIGKFHLGGGYANDNDSLFKFKKTFSKEEPLNFYVGTKIYIKEIYESLVHIRKESDVNFDSANKYFPKYRG